MITDYTTYDDIRAILGASLDEIPDSVISLRSNENALKIALLSITGQLSYDTEERTLEDYYEYIKSLSTPTVEQQKLAMLIENYAAYIVADVLAGSISTLLPKVQADGKSNLTRFSDQSTFISVQIRIKDSLGAILAAINSLFGVSTDISASFVKSIAPAVDKVTGI